jgi:hypothetical protein
MGRVGSGPPRSGLGSTHGRVPYNWLPLYVWTQPVKDGLVARPEDLVQWRLSYRAALERWQLGEREVVFPDGAYWLPHFHGAESGPRAPPAA